MYVAQGGKAGQNDGPKQKATLYYPVRSAAKIHSLCADGHPVESQGAIRIACPLEEWTRSQSVWHNDAERMRMVSKRAKLNDPQAAAQIKTGLCLTHFQILK